jgi:hypothetical protein
MGWSFGWDQKNRGPVSEEVWHDKVKFTPYSKAFSAEHRPKFCRFSAIMVTSPYRWKTSDVEDLFLLEFALWVPYLGALYALMHEANPALNPPHTWPNIGRQRGTNRENGPNEYKFNELKWNLTSTDPIINYCQIWSTNSKQRINRTCDGSRFFGSLL